MPPRPPPFDMGDMDDDSDSNRGGSAQPEDGVKSSSVRKAQNRIAQREFRLRKQQYVRDLEARVEVLSGDKEERVELMTLLIRNLLKENKDLRNMVQTMASFVGEGLGSCLPRLGLSAPQLDAILTRADTDTAYEAFLALKASREMEAANPGLALGEVRRRASSKRKRSSMDGGGGGGPSTVDRGEGSSATPDTTAMTGSGSGTGTGAGAGDAGKRTRQDDSSQMDSALGSYAYLFPDLDAFAANPGIANPGPGPSNWANTYSGPDFQTPQNHMGTPSAYPFTTQFNQVNSGFGLTLPPSQPLSTYSIPPASHSQMSDYATRYPPNSASDAADEVERQRQLRAAVANITNGESQALQAGNMTNKEVEERRKIQEELRQTMEGSTDRADRKTEALQLITYHLNNFRVNHSYNLPTSLRPTKVQRTIPHEHAIDGIIFPSIRDRMILLRGRYDLVDAFHGMLNEFTIHGQDVLDHHSWEISEKWLRDFKLLVDDEVYEITNRWRSQRGDVPLTKPTGSNVLTSSWEKEKT